MTKYTENCTVATADDITAQVWDGRVDLTSRVDGGESSVYLAPSAARRWARGVLTLADQIEGVKDANTIEAGDRIRVLVDNASGSPLMRGTAHTVSEIEGSTVRVPGGGARGMWHLDSDDVEKVTEDAPTLVIPEREALLTRAKELVGEFADQSDVIATARFLAGES